MAIWLCGYVAKCLTGGTGAQVVGEPPARPPLTDLSSELLEPQGKPGWGKIMRQQSQAINQPLQNSLGLLVALEA